MNIGGEIKRLRHARGYTQEELARRCGTYASYIYRVENGIIIPCFDSLQRLLAGLDAKVEIVDGKEI